MRGLRFPEELRIGSALPPLEAAGARAHVVERDDAFAVTIDGLHAEIRVLAGRPAVGGAVPGCWPFGMERRRARAPGATSPAERVFSAPAHPLAVIEWQLDEAAEIHLDVRLDDGLRARIEPEAEPRGDASVVRLGAGGTARIIVTAGDDAPADADAIVATAFARARRRAAQRPSLIVGVEAPTPEIAAQRPGFLPQQSDDVARLEHAIRLSLARPATNPWPARLEPAAPRAREDAESQTLVALALLGLNDRELARERLLVEKDPVRAALIAGAWAAWTGDAEALRDSGPRLTSWLRGELSPEADRADEVHDPDGGRATAPTHDAEAKAWRRAARALAPGFVELLGDTEASALLRSRGVPAPDEALRSLAEQVIRSGGGSASPGAEVLVLLHGTLGIVPDAPRGRLRLGPRMEHPALHLARLNVGDAIFALEASLLGANRAILRVEQTAGGSPNTVILEPWLHARVLNRAWVDGAHAQLDATSDGEGLRPRVQLVTDHTREVLLDFD